MMVAGIPIPPTPTRGSAHDVSDSGSSDVSTTSEEESSVEESGDDDDDDYLKDPDARGSNDPPPAQQAIRPKVPQRRQRQWECQWRVLGWVGCVVMDQHPQAVFP